MIFKLKGKERKMNKKLIALLSAAVMSLGASGVSASMMADTTTTVTKLVTVSDDGTVYSQGYTFDDGGIKASIFKSIFVS